MRDYATAERQHRGPSPALAAHADAAEQAERAERYAGVLKIERGPAAFRVTFPQIAATEKGTPEARAAWDAARRPMADVKAIEGRRFDAMQAAWIVPASRADAIECLALDYGATIEELATAAGFPYPEHVAARAYAAERSRYYGEHFVVLAYCDGTKHQDGRYVNGERQADHV